MPSRKNGSKLIFIATMAITASVQAAGLVLPDSQTHALAMAAADSGILRAQVEQMKSFQDSVLNTAWFALSVVSGVAIALISFSWWNNSRNYERDKKGIRDEISNGLEQRLLDYQEKVNRTLSESEAALSLSLRNAAADTRETLLSAIDSFQNTNKDKMDSLVSQFKKQKESFNEELENLQYDILDNQRTTFRLQDYNGAALILSTQLIQRAVKRGPHWTEQAMMDLSEDIEPFEVKAGRSPERLDSLDTYAAEIITALDKVPDGLRPMAQALKVRVKALPPETVAKKIPAPS